MSESVKTYAVATLTLYFPNNDVCCGKCPVMDKDRANRLYCPMTNMIIDDLGVQNFRCPLNIVAVDKSDDDF